MREMERLAAALFPQGEAGLIDLKFFPGESQVTVDEFCVEAHAAFVQVDRGLATRTSNFPESLAVVPVDRFLSDAQ